MDGLALAEQVGVAPPRRLRRLQPLQSRRARRCGEPAGRKSATACRPADRDAAGRCNPFGPRRHLGRAASATDPTANQALASSGAVSVNICASTITNTMTGPKKLA